MPRWKDLKRFCENDGWELYKSTDHDRLAKDIHVPVSRIQDILHDRRKITADTSVRLGRYFDVSPRYFLNMQDDIDVRNIEIESREDLEKIKTVQYA